MKYFASKTGTSPYVVIAAVAVVAVAVVLGVFVLKMKNSPPTAMTPAQNGQSQQALIPTNPPEPTIAKEDITDTKLDQDQKTVDSKLNFLTNDEVAADSSMNVPTPDLQTQ